MKQKQTMAVWNVKANKFPKKSRWNTKVKYLLNYAILAPSGYNTQPWRFDIQDNHLDIIADMSKARLESDPGNRELYISLGTAVGNIIVAADYFGLKYEIKWLPKGKTNSLVAEMDFADGGEEEKNGVLFEAMAERRTNRNDFESRAIGSKNISKIRQMVKIDGVGLEFIGQASRKMEVSKMIARANQIWLDNKSLVTEMKSWWGMGLRKNTLKSIKEKTRAEKAPDLMIVWSENDDKLSWLLTGVVLEMALLRATSLSIDQAYFNAILQLPDQREKLKKWLGNNKWPQIVMRLGYAQIKAAHSPRQTVKQVVI